MARYRSMVEVAGKSRAQNSVSALAVREENPMQTIGNGQRLHWSVAFPACNVDLGTYRLGLTRAQVDMSLWGIKCTSMCHFSVTAGITMHSGVTTTIGRQETLSSNLGAGGVKVGGKQLDSYQEQSSRTTDASMSLPTNHVKQLTSGVSPSWECITVSAAAQTQNPVAMLDYTAELASDLEVDAGTKPASGKREGVLMFQPAPEDLILVERTTGKLAPGPRMWITLGLMRQRNLIRAYDGQAKLKEIRVKFYLAEVQMEEPRIIPLAD